MESHFYVHSSSDNIIEKKQNYAAILPFLGDRFQHEVYVKDISRQGLGFLMLSVCDIKIGDILEVTFRLDDANKTVISKQVEVKSILDLFVGCQFAGPQWYDKKLGFYLMN